MPAGFQNILFGPSIFPTIAPPIAAALPPTPIFRKLAAEVPELSNCPNKTEIIIKTIKTTGDLFKEKKMSDVGGKNFFCKEIEEK